MQHRWILYGVVMFGAALPAAAQDTYVSAALTADVVRFSGSEAAGVTGLSPDGESLGFALRVGTRLGAAWGVEAEVSRAAEIERETTSEAIPRLAITTDPGAGSIGTGRAAISEIAPLIFPPLSYRVRTAYRDVSFSAGAWARQDFTARFALVYSGGIAFHRSAHEAELTFDRIVVFPELPGLSILPPSGTASEATTYSTRPYVGIEGRIGMTGHLEIVPSVRVHGLDGGVLIRPSVGVGWMF